MKKTGFTILFVTFTLITIGQNVLTIENEKISLEEFKNVLYKNNDRADLSKEYLDEYMQLFVNFKLKVKNANDLKLDTIPTFISELSGYAKQLAKPYLSNKEFDENMLLEAYERMKQDVKVKHILIEVRDQESLKEEKTAYAKILAIRSNIMSDKTSFSDAAKNHSDDKSAIINGGDLGYFTAFMMVYNFETAAYSTKVGDISMPIRTKYGYHLIQVMDKREAVGEVKVAHIMFKSGNAATEKKLNQAKENINKVAELLRNGEKFSDIAERFSEDRATAVKGGTLPSFGVGKMVPEFESIAFSLNKIGEISTPFRTEYGWHIISLLEKNKIPGFDNIKADLKKKIERDSRGELSKQALFAKLHEDYKVVNKPSVYASFYKRFSRLITQGKFTILEKDNNTLFTIENQSISVNRFAEYILLNQNKGGDVDVMYKNFVNKELLAYEESQLEKKYPEYKALLKEYRDGILLFDLTNIKVWKKAIEDTIGLENYYQENINNYLWGKRVNATIYNCIDLPTAKYVKKAIYKKHRGQITDAEILTSANEKAPLSLQVNSKKFLKNESVYIDAIDWKVGISGDVKTKDGGFVIIDVHEVLPKQIKKFNETRGKVISDYQNTLEEQWLDILRKNYSVSIDYELLYTLIK